jgi:hypothetical protein
VGHVQLPQKAIPFGNVHRLQLLELRQQGVSLRGIIAIPLQCCDNLAHFRPEVSAA